MDTPDLPAIRALCSAHTYGPETKRGVNQGFEKPCAAVDCAAPM